MNKDKNRNKEELSLEEIEKTFKKLNPVEYFFTPAPKPPREDNSRWIITGGSSKPTKLIKVSTWQTGQIS